MLGGRPEHRFTDLRQRMFRARLAMQERNHPDLSLAVLQERPGCPWIDPVSQVKERIQVVAEEEVAGEPTIFETGAETQLSRLQIPQGHLRVTAVDVSQGRQYSW
jgi:hypothetical protein